MSQVEINGTKLDYSECGDGQAVVFVHGALSDKKTWADQLEVFGSRFRAVAYSRRYARPNEDIPDGVKDDMMVHIEDLVSLVNVLDLTPAHSRNVCQ